MFCTRIAVLSCVKLGSPVSRHSCEQDIASSCMYKINTLLLHGEHPIMAESGDLDFLRGLSVCFVVREHVPFAGLLLVEDKYQTPPDPGREDNLDGKAHLHEMAL